MVCSDTHTYTFGPVPSRRLGRSLGIDCAPFKVCTYDCVYCQLGRTVEKRSKRKNFFPRKNIVEAVRHRIARIPRPDYLTISGSGEPTLYKGLKGLIKEIKTVANIPCAVLTNGSLFWRKDVRDAVRGADLIIPSLDAGNPLIFQQINRPHPDIAFDDVLRGLRLLREEFEGAVWLEVFLVSGLNDGDREIAEIKKCVDLIAPDRVQLNTAVRVPAEQWVKAVEGERLQQIASFFGDRCEVIADVARDLEPKEFSATRSDVLELLQRRPCTVDDISRGLALHRNEVVKYVGELLETGEIRGEERGTDVFYTAR